MTAKFCVTTIYDWTQVKRLGTKKSCKLPGPITEQTGMQGADAQSIFLSLLFFSYIAFFNITAFLASVTSVALGFPVAVLSTHN